MGVKAKKFIDDGWALWLDGSNESTLYITDWMDPKRKNYTDVSIQVNGVKSTRSLHLYVPYPLELGEIEDISLKLRNENYARAVFASGCIVDPTKDEYTSEIAYSGKTMDIIHISKLPIEVERVGEGTLVSIFYEDIHPYIDNETGYFSFRIPHKTLDALFRAYQTAGSVLTKFREMITSPIVFEKYGYSIRVNEPRHLPIEINKIGAFHRQKLKKAVLGIVLDERYEINESSCVQVRHFENELFNGFAPADFSSMEAVSYQWEKDTDIEEKLKFSFYSHVTKSSVGKISMLIYLILLVVFGAMGNALWDVVKWIFDIY